MVFVSSAEASIKTAPASRASGSAPPERTAAGQRTVVLAIAMIVLLILVVRLFQTGG